MMGPFNHKVTLGFTIRNALRITVGVTSVAALRFWEGQHQVRLCGPPRTATTIDIESIDGDDRTLAQYRVPGTELLGR